MRKTAGKESYERKLGGDRELASVLAEALECSDDVDRYTHGFHTYPAGLHPDAARLLIAHFGGERVGDPFCGGGTTLVEALAAGRAAEGRDLSPTALRVAIGRTAVLSEEELTKVRSAARKLAEKGRNAQLEVPEEVEAALGAWYAPHALVELYTIQQGIQEYPEEIRPYLEFLFSSILIKTSWRKSDTSAKREVHRRPAGTTAILFHKKAREWGRRVAALREVVPEGTPAVNVAEGDARELAFSAPVDLILTSPPYPSVYDYLPMQHLRDGWFGIRASIEAEIGSRRSWRTGHKKARRTWADDTVAWTKAAAENLVPGGHLVVVIGDGLTPKGPVDTTGTSIEAAREAGLEVVARASVARPDYARKDVRWEHIFAFRRPE